MNHIPTGATPTHRFRGALAAALVLIVPALTHGQSQPDHLAQRRGQKPQRILAAQQALARHSAALGLGPKDSLEPVSSAFDERGRLRVRFVRRHQGVRVLGAGLKVAVANDDSVSVTHPARREVNLPTAVPAISEVAAKESIARDLKLTAPEVEFEAELVVEARDEKRGPWLAWMIRADAPGIAAARYFIDARTGAIVTKERANASVVVPANGTGYTFYRGHVNVTTHFVAAEGKYILQDPTRGNTFVYDVMDKKPNWAFHGNHYYDANNVWGNGQDWQYGGSTTDATGQTVAVDAMNGARATWDLLKNVFNHEGFADDGGPLRLRVHYREVKDEPYGDANFDGYFINFGDGLDSDDPHRAQLSTVAHEIGHGVWHAFVADKNRGEAKGLNEGHGDIVASLTGHYEVLAGGQGPAIPSAPPGDVSKFLPRSVNPRGYSTGGQMGWDFYPTGPGQVMGDYDEHVQGTVYGHMFAMLAGGAPSIAEAQAGPPCPPDGTASFNCLASNYLPQGMAGIGIHDAARIWYEATVAEFDDKPTFWEARLAYLAAAENLFGLDSPQHKSVMNAFAAVNLGSEALDTAKPDVSLSEPVVDPAEQTVYVEAIGTDDIGVRRLRLNVNGYEKAVLGGAFKGYLDLSSAPLGNRDVTVTAFDAVGKEAQASRIAKYKGSLFAIENRGFEKGLENWSVSTNQVFGNAGDVNAFLGTGFISFSGTEWIRQKFTLPEETTSCTVGYRLRVNPGGIPSQMIRVDLMQSNGTDVAQHLNMVFANQDTTDPTSNNYKAYRHTVNGCGGTLWLRFKTESATTDGFRIDNAFVTYTIPVTADFEATADATEGSVIIQVKNIQNAPLSHIKEMRFDSAGGSYSMNYLPYIMIRPTSEFVTGVPYNVSASPIDWLGDPMATFGPEQFVVQSVNQLIMNPGFEGGLVWWDISGSAALCGHNPAGGQGPAAFIGTGCVYFDGTGFIYQTVTIPNGPGTVKLSFRLKIDRGSAADKLQVIAENVHTGVAAEVGAVIGSTSTLEDVSHMNYRKFVYDLTPFKGQKIRLKFATTKGAPPMTYFIDNIGASHSGPAI